MKQLQSSNYEYITLHDDNCKVSSFLKIFQIFVKIIFDNCYAKQSKIKNFINENRKLIHVFFIVINCTETSNKEKKEKILNQILKSSI